MAKDAVREFNGIPDRVAFIALTRDPITGLDLPGVNLTIITTEELNLTDSGSDKQTFSLIIKEVAHKGNAVMVCFLIGGVDDSRHYGG